MFKYCIHIPKQKGLLFSSSRQFWAESEPVYAQEDSYEVQQETMKYFLITSMEGQTGFPKNIV